MSRTDDILNVAGHRLSSGLLEEACLSHPKIVECAVVAHSDDVKGSVPIAFVVSSCDDDDVDVVPSEVVSIVRDRVGAVAALRTVLVVPALPKTRSGKILRKTMRSIVDGESYRVPGTIEDAKALRYVHDAIERHGFLSK